ncbi:MAG TPA: hypothetical protein PK141_28880 [Polyangiaceae bacterium]|nr:hypothetical protein [Polyangiaceae bacterium]
MRRQLHLEQTTAGTAVAAALSTVSPLGELRRLGGFTWEQLARLLHVSRRMLHFWASGGPPMARSNEEHLQRVLAVVRTVDRGSASKNRTLLLGPREDAREGGTVPLDLLATGDYESVVGMLGPGEARRAAPVAKLSAEAGAARAPRPPAELVSALHDRIHPTSGRLLGAKPIVTSRRK